MNEGVGGVRALCLVLLVACLLYSPALLAQSGPVSAAASPGAATLPVGIPVQRDPGSDDSIAMGGRAWLGFAAAGALLGLAVLLARRSRRASGGGSLWRARVQLLFQGASPCEVQRVAGTRLSPRHSLHVVEWEGRRLLIGCGDQSVQLLAESPGRPGASAGLDVNSQDLSRASS